MKLNDIFNDSARLEQDMLFWLIILFIIMDADRRKKLERAKNQKPAPRKPSRPLQRPRPF